MSQLTDADRKAFWLSGTGVLAKFLFQIALFAFVAPIVVTIFMVVIKITHINGVGVGLGILVSILFLFAGAIVSIVGLATYRKK